jgi:hypothetical protein
VSIQVIESELKGVLQTVAGVATVHENTPEQLYDLPAITMDYQGRTETPFTMGSFLVSHTWIVRIYVDMGTDQDTSKETLKDIAADLGAKIRANLFVNDRIWRFQEGAVEKTEANNSRPAWVFTSMVQIQTQEVV